MSPDVSSPPSAGSTLTGERGLDDIKTNGLHLDLAPFSLEHVFDYEAGGHHPVHLGDTLGNGGRYRVIHKLGHGGFATVWLCRDAEGRERPKYVAVKIIMADASTEDCPELQFNQLKSGFDSPGFEGGGAMYMCFPLEHFNLKGPNGDHFVFVYPVHGPNVSLGIFEASADPDSDLKSLCLQVAKAVQFLHSQGICHGDLTPKNILHRISGLDGLSEEKIFQLLGIPVQNTLLNDAQEPHNLVTAPRYLVYPVKWEDVETKFICKEASIIDFGESFKASQPPEDLGTPGPYRSPDLMLEKKAGFASDIWALGCTIFEIRTGRKLFNLFDDEDDDYLDAMIQIFGKMPEPWWSTTWKERRRMYKDEVDEHGRAVSTLEPAPIEKSDEGEESYASTVHPSVASGARSLKEMIATGVWYMPGPDFGKAEELHREISQTEQELLADLLGRLLKYRPEDRISAEEAIGHDWFKP